jgi:hypothetical protein
MNVNVNLHPKDNPHYLGEQLSVTTPISLPAQIAIGEAALDFAEYFASHGEKDKINILHQIPYYLSLQNEHGPMDFIGLMSYLAHLEEALGDGRNPTSDTSVKKMRQLALDDLANAKTIYKQKAKRGWDE